MNQDPTLDYDDMFTGLTDEVMKNIYIRFYSMEEYFQLGKPNPKSTPNEQIGKTKTSQKSVYFLFNKMIHESIHKLFIMNRLIYNKAKLVNSLLENGFQISDKKNVYWQFFMEEPEFYKIREAYELVTEEKKQIIKYAVLSISNILLKLSINMSKISAIPLQKFVTFQRLNIPVLSIIFLQFLQYRLLVAKKHSDAQQNTSFLKQLPKVTVIRLGKYKNNTEMDLLETSQFHLFTNKSQLETPVRNLQFIDIHEFDEDPYYPNYQRKKPYEHILSLSLQDIGQGSIKSPFTFQILFLMETIVHPLVRQFRPDIILYMQEYPFDMKIMDEEIRGLMISQLTEETACQKIYVFKEMGFDKSEILRGYIDDGEKVDSQMAEIMEKIEMKQSEKLKLKPDNKRIRKAKKIILDDLCFISLALIQKTSFDNCLDASHRFIYPHQFLEGLERTCDRLKSQIKSSNQSFYRALDQKKFALKNMKDMTKILSKPNQEMMDQNQQKGIHIINLMATETHFSSFYDLLNKESQELVYDGKKYLFGEQDNLYVKYYTDRLIVFIIKPLSNCVELTAFSKNRDDKQLNLIKNLKLNKQQNDLEGATYVASDCYLYRGFGKFRHSCDAEGESNYNTSIHRLKIFPQIGNNWELVGSESACLNSDGSNSGNCELEAKKYGYAIFSKNEKAPNKNMVVFIGGYIDMLSQERISPKFYIIKDAEGEKVGDPKKSQKNIISIGKTNKVLFKDLNLPLDKVFLHPFVFGISFQENGVFILNGNGNYINLNNTNKIFGTQVKLSPIDAYNGIIKQYKLKLPNDSAQLASQVIIVAQLLCKLLVFSSCQVNTFKNEACIQTLEEGLVKMSVDIAKKQLQVKPEDQLFETDQIFKLSFV